MFAVSQMRHKMTIGDKEDKDMKSNLLTDVKNNFPRKFSYNTEQTRFYDYIGI